MMCFRCAFMRAMVNGLCTPCAGVIATMEPQRLAAVAALIGVPSAADVTVPAIEAAIAAEVCTRVQVADCDPDFAVPAKVQADEVTARKILEAGFEYPPGSGQIFSTSKASQDNWHATLSAVTFGLIDPVATPVQVATRDNGATVSFATVGDVQGAAAACLAAVNGARVAGLAVKAAIDAATTWSAAQAIVQEYGS